MFGTSFHLSHFSAMVIFALFVSMAFACLARKTWAARIKYALWSLALFLAIGIGVAWLMYPLLALRAALETETYSLQRVPSDTTIRSDKISYFV